MAFGELRGALHDGAHVLHAGGACVAYCPVYYLLELLWREGFWQVGADDLGLGRFARRLLFPAGFAKRFGGLLALLELAPEDGLLLLLS